MKLWLIKLGKVISAIRSEGLIRGGGRALRSFFALFRPVGSGDVLFVTGGWGDSARYRSWHVAEELELHGFACSVTTQDNPFIPRYAKRFGIFVFHRVMYTPSVAKLIDRAKKQGKAVIFETDDLVYDAEYLKHMDAHFRKMNVFERKQYEGGVGAEILADPYVEVATASTDYLAEKLRERGKRVFVVPNRLSVEDTMVMDSILAKEPDFAGATTGRREVRGEGDSTERIVIGYFSGAKSHDKDFAAITDVLIDILDRHSEVRLFIGGPLELDSRFGRFAGRISRRSYVPRAEHFANVSRVDINIAPLEVGNPFCESKSELKFFEAGYLGVPTVASATDPFRRAIADGVDGYVATTPDEWRDKLERLIADAELRPAMGGRAREKVITRFTTAAATNEEYYAYLRSQLK